MPFYKLRYQLPFDSQPRDEDVGFFENHRFALDKINEDIPREGRNGGSDSHSIMSFKIDTLLTPSLVPMKFWLLESDDGRECEYALSPDLYGYTPFKTTNAAGLFGVS